MKKKVVFLLLLAAAMLCFGGCHPNDPVNNDPVEETAVSVSFDVTDETCEADIADYELQSVAYENGSALSADSYEVTDGKLKFTVPIGSLGLGEKVFVLTFADNRTQKLTVNVMDSETPDVTYPTSADGVVFEPGTISLDVAVQNNEYQQLTFEYTLQGEESSLKGTVSNGKAVFENVESGEYSYLIIVKRSNSEAARMSYDISVKESPVLAVNADVTDEVAPVSMGDYVLTGIELAGETFEDYTFENGELLFPVGYGSFGEGTTELTLKFEGGVTKTLVLTITDSAAPEVIFPVLDNEDNYQELGTAVFPAAQKGNANQNLQFSYTLTEELLGDSEGTPVVLNGTEADGIVSFNVEKPGIYHYTITVSRGDVVFENPRSYAVCIGMETKTITAAELQMVAIDDDGRAEQCGLFDFNGVECYHVSTWGWMRFYFDNVNLEGYSAVFFDYAAGGGANTPGEVIAGINNNDTPATLYSGWADVNNWYHGYFQATSGKLAFYITPITDFFITNVTLVRIPVPAEMITVTYDLNGGTSDQSTTQTFEKGSAAEFITATHPGKNATLVNWIDVSTNVAVTDLSALTQDTSLKARWRYDLDLSGDVGYYSPDGRTGAWNPTAGYFEMNSEGWARLNFQSVNFADYLQVSVFLQTSEAGSLRIGASSNNEDIENAQSLTFNAWEEKWVWSFDGVASGHLMIYVDSGCLMVYVKQIQVMV